MALTTTLPANELVRMEVSSDLTREPARYPNFPPEGYYHRAVIKFSNGTEFQCETPEPAVKQKMVYGGPVFFPTGTTALDVTVEVFEAPVIPGQPRKFTPIRLKMPDPRSNSKTFVAEGHTGSGGDWDDTVVRFSW